MVVFRLQIPLEVTTLDAAKSSIVYSVAKGVSTAGRAVSDVTQNHNCKQLIGIPLAGNSFLHKSRFKGRLSKMERRTA